MIVGLSTIGFMGAMGDHFKKFELRRATEIGKNKYFERNDMKIYFIFVLFLLTGCGGGVPEMPKLNTEFTRTCYQVCQKAHAQCIRELLQAKKSGGTFKPCNQVLRQCYQTCTEMKP